MVTKGRPGPTVAAAAPVQKPLNGVLPNHTLPASNGTVRQRSAAAPEAPPAKAAVDRGGKGEDASEQAAPDAQVQSQGQANPQQPPNPSGEAPAENELQKKKCDDQTLAKAQTIVALRNTLALAKGDPWPEPQQPSCHWDFLLREASWLAADFSQERLWKRALARQLAHEAAKINRRAQLKPADGDIGEEVRAAISEAAIVQEDMIQTRRAHRERTESGRSAGVSSSIRTKSEDKVFGGLDADGDIAPGTPPQAGETIFHYMGSLELMEAAELQLRTAADQAVIDQEVKIREYEQLYERSVQEAKEQALATRRQIAAELRGRDTTPIGDFDDDYGKKTRRKKQRASYDDFGLDAELLPTSKRMSSLRKQQNSRPDSAISDDGRREREVKRKRKMREYDDEDYEEPLRTRETNKRKPPMDRDRRSNLRSDQRNLRSLNKKASGLGQRQGSRSMLDGGLPWTQAEDSLLCSIVHEFDTNWRLIADIFGTSSAMSGIYRSPLQCRTRFRELAAPHVAEGNEVQEKQVVLEAMRINKTFARDLLNKSLPAPDAVLQLHQKVLLQLALAAREKRLRSRQQEKQAALRQTEPHHTVLHAQEAALRTNHGRIPTPLQLIEANDAQQQALAAQQLAAQQQAVHAQQAVAAAAAAPPVAPGASGGAAVASGGANSGATASLTQDNSASSVPGQGSINSQQNQQLPLQQSASGSLSQGPPAGTPNFSMAPAQAMPPPASIAQQAQQRPHVTIPHLQQILQSGRMPNGKDINPAMRAQLVGRLQALQRNAAAAAAAANRGMQPGMMAGMQSGLAPSGMQIPAGNMRPGMPPMQAAHTQPGQQAIPGSSSPVQLGGAMQPGVAPMGAVPGNANPGGVPGIPTGVPLQPSGNWPAGSMQPRMQSMRPMGMPPGMSQGMNLAQAQVRPPMQGPLPPAMQQAPAPQ